jgi:succinate dehydrogenase / fumarate reductase cytochrome b subunit
MAETRDRPLSPFLTVWRWHITMAASIAHRATGTALYVGALILAGWALALAGGPSTYQVYMDLLGSWLGKLVLFGLTVSIFYHLANGIRHIVFDFGKGFELKWADFGAAFAFAFAIVISVLVWVFAIMTGAF